MDERRQPLQQCAPLLPTGVADGLKEALRSIRYGRQTRQGQRIGYEDQTRMFPDGFGTPHAILVRAQPSLAVLRTPFRRPPLQRQSNGTGCVPIHAVRDLHHKASRHLRVRKAHLDPDLVQARNADPQREAPVGVPADGDGAIRLWRDQRHRRLDRDMRSWQLHGPVVGMPQLWGSTCPQYGGRAALSRYPRHWEFEFRD